MESNQKHQIQVGIFVGAGLLVILFSILMLGADRALIKSYVEIQAEFEQVQGLNEGSVVSLSGVVAGNVKKIEFNEKTNLLEVTFKIEKSLARKISRSSQVEIRTQGALGDKYVFIIPGNPGDESIKNGDKLNVAKPSDIIGIFSERGKETGKIFDIINEMYITIKSVNSQDRIGKIMEHLSEASANLNIASQETKKFTLALGEGSTQNKIKDSVDRLNHIIEKIDRGQGTLGALINDPTLHNQLKAIVGGNDRKKQIRGLIRTSIEKNEGI